MQQRERAVTRRQQLADLVVVVVIAVLVGVYLRDAVSASTAFLHLILVLPLSVVILLLCGLAAVRILAAPAGKRAAAAGDADEPGRPVDAGIVIALFAIYVATLGQLGFDVGTALFIGAFLRLHGERRWPRLVAYPLACGFGLAFLFSALLPYDMPMLLIGRFAG